MAWAGANALREVAVRVFSGPSGRRADFPAAVFLRLESGRSWRHPWAKGSARGLQFRTPRFPRLRHMRFFLEFLYPSVSRRHATRWTGPCQLGISPMVNNRDTLLMTRNQNGADACLEV